MATKTTIEMASEAAGDDWGLFQEFMPEIHRLAELVRADERNSWPAEMEAMERQVNILTDALAEEREKWMERTAILIRGEREACAKVCDDLALPPDVARSDASIWEVATLDCAEAIRNRSNT